MHLSISAKTLKYLQQQIKSGRFDSLEQAVNQLLESQVSRERLTDADLRLLKNEIEFGLKDFERGDFAAWDPEAILADVEKIHHSRRKRVGSFGEGEMDTLLAEGERSIGMHGTMDGEKSFARRRAKRNR